MASPRKFSEKIALHNQKQAEETAEFEKIMREVGSATRGAYQAQHLHINQSLGSYRGGSLPNVNQIGNNSIDLQSALTSLEEIKQGRDALVDRVYRESRPRHIGPHRRQFEKRVDCSPYGSPYLSPPPDTSWRRTNSDSALHQSTINPSDNFHGSTTPPANRRVHEDGVIIADGTQFKGFWDTKKQLLPPPHSRPKSCEVPGINIYPTEQDPNIVHISIANNTGSLPDLTNLQFQSPLPTPLDAEDQTGSNYSTSPQQQVSPSSLSPTSLTPTLARGGSVSPSSVGGGGGVGAPDPTQHGCSPGPPQAQRRRPHHPMLTNLIISGNPVQQSNYNLRVPSVHTRFLHTCKGMTTESSRIPMDSYVPSHQQASQYHVYQQSLQQQPQHQQQSLSVVNTTDAANSMSYRSSSPADTSYSAPQSPVSQTLSPVSSPGLGPPPKDPFTDSGGYYIPTNAQTNALQEHFQQFNMIDTPPASSVSNIFLSDGNSLQYSQVQNVGLVDGRDMLDGSVYYGAIDQYSRGGHSTALSSPGGAGQNQPATPQTPQTPSSIPNIILTDFSSGPGAEDPMSRQDFVKDIGSAMAGISSSFDSDLFVTDDLKAGLDPIDFDGLQMLTDPDMVTDPATEDSFRLDRL